MQGLGLGQDEAVIAALREWRFEPGKKGGRAVPVEAEVVVTFRLRGFQISRLAYSAAPLAPPPNVHVPFYPFVGESCDAVSLEFLIQASGMVSDFLVLRGTNESMQMLAQSTVSGRQFLPANENGVPVPRRAEVDFSCEPWPASAR